VLAMARRQAMPTCIRGRSSATHRSTNNWRGWRAVEPTTLTAQSLRFAALDAAARREERSLFEGLTVPESHWPAAAGEAPPAFDTIKVKMPEGELPPRGRLRLDSTPRSTPHRFSASLRHSRGTGSTSWKTPAHTTATFGANCARKRAATGARPRGGDGGRRRTGGEPAIQSVVGERMLAGGGREGTPDDGAASIVVTSYMDHPVGQLHAAAGRRPRCDQSALRARDARTVRAERVQ